MVSLSSRGGQEGKRRLQLLLPALQAAAAWVKACIPVVVEALRLLDRLCLLKSVRRGLVALWRADALCLRGCRTGTRTICPFAAGNAVGNSRFACEMLRKGGHSALTDRVGLPDSVHTSM
ncbi:hypothetical protein Naga_100108g16 [Nannochloropsis gaditana]|uniref:Uncharacterized protein n=1 Tax=Nannochloropsis gaditana TaxID=72520 RepID=W7TK98_9STRA|nr:hypothetical protein Naga_100108g16 [Nannochloropsis gaditana]